MNVSQRCGGARAKALVSAGGLHALGGLKFLLHPLTCQIQALVGLHNLKPSGAGCDKKTGLVFNQSNFSYFCIYQVKVLSSTKCSV